jgi:uncharacterized membrane protein YfcA
LLTHFLFSLVAILAGGINSLAGGGGLITCPLLTLVMPAVAADATSAVGLVLASSLSRRPYGARGTRSPRSLGAQIWWLLVPSVLGGLVGALLLVYTNERNFTFLVPWLILVGTVLSVIEPRLSRRSSGSSSSRIVSSRLLPLALVVTLVVAVYGGYFGAGIGILMISALSPFGLGDVSRVVPLKNLLIGCLRGVAVAVHIVGGVVNWSYGIPMMVGGLIGGYVGGMVSNRAPRRFLRALVIGSSWLSALASPHTTSGMCTARRSHASGANSGPDTPHADSPTRIRLA